jgi:hypothetical protein
MIYFMIYLFFRRKNYILFHDLQEALNKPRQNVVRLLKRTKVREISLTEFKKEVSSSYFNKLSECPPGSEEGKVELVPLNWTVRSLLKIKCEHLALWVHGVWMLLAGCGSINHQRTWHAEQEFMFSFVFYFGDLYDTLNTPDAKINILTA